MGYRLSMTCIKYLDQAEYAISGKSPGSRKDNESKSIEFLSSFTHGEFQKYEPTSMSGIRLFPFEKTIQMKTLARLEVEQICPDVNFDFYDKARSFDLVWDEGGPWLLHDPVDICHAFECMSTVLDELEIEYDFRECYDLCDQAIEWNQKIITGRG